MLEVDESILDKLSEAFYLLLRGSPAAPIELPPEYPENEVRQLVGYINRFLGEYGDLSGGMSSIARGDLDFSLGVGRLAALQPS